MTLSEAARSVLTFADSDGRVADGYLSRAAVRALREAVAEEDRRQRATHEPPAEPLAGGPR